MKSRTTSLGVLLSALVIAMTSIHCNINLKEIAPMVEVGGKKTAEELREAEIHYDLLTFDGKAQFSVPYHAITALGTNGRRTYLYFGDKTQNNKLFAFNLATKELSSLATKVKNKSHDKEGAYDAASDKTITQNPKDMTVITSIVAGPLDSAVVSLTGLLHRRGGVYGTAAHGGVLEVENDVVKGVWGNVIGSLNSADSKEISVLASVKDSWIAFSKDINSVAAFRRFKDKMGQAKEGPTGPEGRSFGTIVTAALGVGNELYVAYDGSVKRINTESLDELCAIDLGQGASLESLTSPKDMQILKGGSEIIVVSALAMVGRKLLVGMTNYGQNGGGVAVVDLEKDKPTITAPPREQLGVSITHMAVSEDGKSAMISTDGKGLIFYAHDQFFPLTPNNLEYYQEASVSKTHPFAFNGVSDNNEIFKPAKAQIGAVQANGTWYIATTDGIVTLTAVKKIKSEEAPNPL